MFRLLKTSVHDGTRFRSSWSLYIVTDDTLIRVSWAKLAIVLAIVSYLSWRLVIRPLLTYLAVVSILPL